MVNTDFKFEGDLIGNLENMNETVRKGMLAAAEYAAPAIQTYMRQEAPWTDRTGAARNGLRTKVTSRGSNGVSTQVAIVLYHSVPYGPYLELRWGGKYGVILQAMAFGGPLWLEAMAKTIFSDFKKVT